MICVQPAYAIFGIGGHYSFDLSVSMPDAEDKLVFDNLSMSGAGFGGTYGNSLANLVFQPQDLPIYFDRTDFKRTPFAIGAKVYIDIIPLIDVIEVGGDIACWEYSGGIRYPAGISVNSDPGAVTSLLTMQENNIVTIDYDTMDLTLEENGLRFPGISETPYIKLNLGLTIRKYIPIKAIDKVLRPYLGAGFDVHFATPVPTATFVKDALGDALNGERSLNEIIDIFNNPANSKDVTQKIINKLFTPHIGMNIVAGLMIKLPVIPIGIYGDGKFMIPFEKLDTNANVEGLGFKINTGLVFHIGKAKD
jgi:hypothetical protein